jgi:hypothetical protein
MGANGSLIMCTDRAPTSKKITGYISCPKIKEKPRKYRNNLKLAMIAREKPIDIRLAKNEMQLQNSKRLRVYIDEDYITKVDDGLSDNALNHFFALQTCASTLLKLRLEFSDYTFWNENMVRELKELFPKLTQLISLTIHISEARSPDLRVQSFEGYSSVSKLPQLQELKVRLPLKRNFNDRDVLELSDAFECFPLLTSLKLDFSNFLSGIVEFETDDERRTVDSTRDSKKFQTPGKIRARSYFETFCQSMARLNKLDLLHLNFTKCEMTFENLELLSQELVKLNDLTSFTFIAAKNDISDYGFNLLTTALGEISNLRSLSLNFNKNKGISDKGLDNFSEILKKLQKLSYLSLEFGSTDVADVGITRVASTFTELEALKILKLCFHETLITNNGFGSLTNSLKNLTDLTTLALDFSFCQRIADRTVTSVTTYFPNTLIELDLNFASCLQVTDKAVESISSEISKLTQIASLTLNFNGCDISADSDKNLRAAGKAIMADSQDYSYKLH